MDNYKKKYQGALNVARFCSEHTDSVQDIELINLIFPELKESDEEQSKKWILEYLHDGLRKSDEQFKDHFKAAIAWLEKQGEQKSIDDLTQQEAMDIAVAKCFEQGEQKPQRMVSAEAKETMYDKPTWSEEDENMLKLVIKSCEQCGNEYAYYWLKSLKDRVQSQPKQEWKPSEEQMEALRKAEATIGVNHVVLAGLISDLEKLKG